jgi:RNA polymerase sigma factor (sigma-70 family)
MPLSTEQTTLRSHTEKGLHHANDRSYSTGLCGKFHFTDTEERASFTTGRIRMEATRDEIKSCFKEILQRDDGTFEKWLASANFRLHKYCLLRYESAHDVVHTLFVKLMDGRRKWDKEKDPDFAYFIFRLIHSHILNLAITRKEEVEFDEDRETQAWDDLNTHGPLHEFMEICLQRVSRDESLVPIFYAFSDGLSNREVARELNMRIRDVQNAKKRIIRRLQPVYERYYKSSEE